MGLLRKKIVSEIIMTLLLMSMLTLNSGVQPVKSESKAIIVPDDYPTIQEAINAAKDGNEILVKRGTYLENVVVNKSVSLVGEGRGNTVIDSLYRIFNVTANNVKVMGFTFLRTQVHVHRVHGGEVSENLFYYNLNHFITLFESSNVTVAHNRIQSTQVEGVNLYVWISYGESVGINLYKSSHNNIYYNTVTEQAHGIRLSLSNSNRIMGNTVTNSEVCIRLEDSHNNTIVHNNFISLLYVPARADYQPTIPVSVYKSYNNSWNDDYPFGGNCWNGHHPGYWPERYHPAGEISYPRNNYHPVDNFKGPFQNVSGTDWISDVPFVIDEYNIDAYPLVKFWWIPGMDILPIDPTPPNWADAWLNQFMIGSVAVSIILPESNGTIDPSTEDWTDEEIENVTSKIQFALDWWASLNPNAGVSFVTEVHARVPISYEPVSRPGSNMSLWMVEILAYLGFPPIRSHYSFNMANYISELRLRHNTDWAFAIIVFDSSNDEDGLWEGGGHPFCANGMWIVSSSTNWKRYWGIEKLDMIMAHEIGHVFGATDEYKGTADNVPGTTINRTPSGYLGVPDIFRSTCLMDREYRPGDDLWFPGWTIWRLSGAPHGMNGTWGQVGWRDSDGDGIQDIVDTFPQIYLNPPRKNGRRLNYTGTAAATPILNRDHGGIRSVTINKIANVQFRIDEGEWLNATTFPATVKKTMKYDDKGYTIGYKETRATVNFTFLTPPLEAGEYFIEVKAVDQWGNERYINMTVTVPETLPTDLNADGVVNILDITIVAKAFGSRPGDENWNETVDMDKNGVINIIDISMVARDYGRLFWP
jgi:parallel beta-helix repeat protein